MQRNPHSSLRSFAKQLGVDHSTLSERKSITNLLNEYIF